MIGIIINILAVWQVLNSLRKKSYLKSGLKPRNLSLQDIRYLLLLLRVGGRCRQGWQGDLLAHHRVQGGHKGAGEPVVELGALGVASRQSFLTENWSGHPAADQGS